MVTPDNSLDIQHAGWDISTASIYVEGAVGAGRAACLVPRRYRKRPEWWAIEVVSVDAPSSGTQKFRLACAGEGLWGTEGIEIVGPSSSIKIPGQEALMQPESAKPSMSEKLSSASSNMAAGSNKLTSKARQVSSTKTPKDDS